MAIQRHVTNEKFIICLMFVGETVPNSFCAVRACFDVCEYSCLLMSVPGQCQSGGASIVHSMKECSLCLCLC